MMKIRELYAKVPERVRLIAVAAIAFLIGNFMSGPGGAVGRYVPLGGSGSMILDTRTGAAWEMIGGRYTRVASFSYF